MTSRSSSITPTQFVSARRSGHLALAVILGCRAVINAVLAFWLWNAKPGWSAIFGGATVYLAADGLCALVATGVLALGVIDEAPRLLIAATAADGLLRCIAAIALRAFPGLPDFPVTAVGFFGIVGSCAICLAVAAISIRYGAWRSRRRARERTSLAEQEELDPMFLAGVLALALVIYAFIAGPPASAADYRALGMSWATLLGVGFAVAAFGVMAARRELPR